MLLYRQQALIGEDADDSLYRHQPKQIAADSIQLAMAS